MMLSGSECSCAVAVADTILIIPKSAVREAGAGGTTANSSILMIQNDGVIPADLHPRRNADFENSEEAEEELSRAPAYPAAHNAGLTNDRLDLADGRWFSALALSPSGRMLAAADNFKVLRVYSVSEEHGNESHDLRTLNSWILSKRTMAMTWTSDEEKLIVADKLGDAYVYDVRDKAPKHSLPVLGHISVLTDVALTRDNRFILTSDRDEKIRVSRFPLADDIQAFCLGHTEFVSRLVVPFLDSDVVISGSGDGTVRAFSYLTGDQLGCIVSETTKDARSYVVGLEYVERLQMLFVAYARQSTVFGYRLRMKKDADGSTKFIGFIRSLRLRLTLENKPVSVRSIRYVDDCLVVLQNDLRQPLGFYTNLAAALGHLQSTQTSDASEVNIDKELFVPDDARRKLHEIVEKAEKAGQGESLLCDVLLEFFNESDRASLPAADFLDRKKSKKVIGSADGFAEKVIRA